MESVAALEESLRVLRDVHGRARRHIEAETELLRETERSIAQVVCELARRRLRNRAIAAGEIH